MTWILIRLKVRLLRNAFRSSAGLGLVMFTFFAGAISFTLTALIRRAAADDLVAFAPLLSAVMIGGWALVPLMFGASDEMVDSTRLATFPLRATQLAPGMAASAMVGPGPIAAAVPLCFLPCGPQRRRPRLSGWERRRPHYWWLSDFRGWP